jgi:hypothetical protein
MRGHGYREPQICVSSHSPRQRPLPPQLEVHPAESCASEGCQRLKAANEKAGKFDDVVAYVEFISI